MYWFYKNGPKNNLCDVKGLRVGHVSLNNDSQGIHTGVTAILPPGPNPYQEKYIAAAHCINGFGKPLGLEQVRELGQMESPILLTNTLSIGDATRGLMDYMLDIDPNIGRPTTLNPLVLECNDGSINDIRRLALQPKDALEALTHAQEDFSQGSVGAGTGMVCYGLKGGIGSASRLVDIHETTYTIGALVLSNFGATKDLTILGEKLGPKLATEERKDRGSIVTILATDLPIDSRQVLRLCKRVQSGIARTGAFTSHGSGEFALGFTTCKTPSLLDQDLDPAFQATVEAVEEAILSSLYHNESKTAYTGEIFQSLKDRARDKKVSLPSYR